MNGLICSNIARKYPAREPDHVIPWTGLIISFPGREYRRITLFAVDMMAVHDVAALFALGLGAL